MSEEVDISPYVRPEPAISPYEKMSKKLHSIFNKLKESQSDDEEGLIADLGPVKEINSTQFQFQSAVYRDPGAEVNEIKFSGFDKLVGYLSKYLGKPKEKTEHIAAWETIQPDKNHVRISVVVYNAGDIATSSLKVTIGPLKSDLL